MKKINLKKFDNVKIDYGLDGFKAIILENKPLSQLFPWKKKKNSKTSYRRSRTRY